MKFDNTKLFNNYLNKVAKEKNTSYPVILQNYMLERLLERISISKYKDNFILKGGLLVSSILGIDNRNTKDMDTSIKNINLNKENILKIVDEIIKIELNDSLNFKISGTSSIMENAEYEGLNISIICTYGNEFKKPRSNLSIDIATGDVITPSEILYNFNRLFDAGTIKILAYPVETILAEKYQTILDKGIVNSRAKDFYDIYALTTLRFDLINKDIFIQAVIKTFKNRNSEHLLDSKTSLTVINHLNSSEFVKSLWNKYKKSYAYAKDINFDDIIIQIKLLQSFIK